MKFDKIDDRHVTKRKPPNKNKGNTSADVPDAVAAAPSPPPTQPRQKKRRSTGRLTISKKSNLLLPVTRIKRYLRQDLYADKCSPKAAIYLAAVLEYIAAEVFDISGDVAVSMKTTRINPRHLILAIKNDESISRLLPNLTIPEGGVVPHIDPFLVREQKPRKTAAAAATEESQQGDVEQNESYQQHADTDDDDQNSNYDVAANMNTNNSSNKHIYIEEPDWDGDDIFIEKQRQAMNK